MAVRSVFGPRFVDTVLRYQKLKISYLDHCLKGKMVPCVLGRLFKKGQVAFQGRK